MTMVPEVQSRANERAGHEISLGIHEQKGGARWWGPRLRRIGLIGLIVLSLGALSWAVNRTQLPPADFTFSNLGEIKTVDPALVTGQAEGRVVWAIFEGLTAWNPRTLEPEPAVAHAWQMSEDQLTYTFFLRPEAKWSDGSPLGAEDFVWSFRRFLHPETAAEYAPELWYIVGAKKFTSGKVDVGDPVEIELPEKPAGAPAFACGKILRGRLVAIETADGNRGNPRGNPADDHLGTSASAESIAIAAGNRSHGNGTRTSGESGQSSDASAEGGQSSAGSSASNAEGAPGSSGAEAAASAPSSGGEDSQGRHPPIYRVQIDGREYRFQKGAVSPGTRDYRWLLYDFAEVGVRAIDRYTLQITLRHPVPYFLNLMGFYPMSPVPRHCIEKHGYPAWTKPENIVTNGPFVLQWRRIRDRIRLVKNPYYWDKENVRLEVVDVLAVESYATNLNLYLTGQVDWIPAVPAEVIGELRARPEKDFHTYPLLATYYYLLNTSRPPLDDPRVRRALSMAIDRQEIVEKVTRGGQQPLYSMVPGTISEWIDYRPQSGPSFNPEEARRLLAEAGYPGGRQFPPIDILYNTSQAHQAIAELIQAHWQRHLGIPVGLRNQEWAAYLNSRRQGDFYVARAGWVADYVDPITFLDLFSGDSPLNNTRWNHPKYNQLLEMAREEPDRGRRFRVLEEAERLLMQELPAIPLYGYVSQNLVQPYVKGFYPNLQDYHPLKAIWIDRSLKAFLRGEEPRQ